MSDKRTKEDLRELQVLPIERNRIYNMDCLVGIRNMIRDKVFVDCVITDPPISY